MAVIFSIVTDIKDKKRNESYHKNIIFIFIFKANLIQIDRSINLIEKNHVNITFNLFFCIVLLKLLL